MSEYKPEWVERQSAPDHPDIYASVGPPFLREVVVNTAFCLFLRVFFLKQSWRLRWGSRRGVTARAATAARHFQVDS